MPQASSQSWSPNLFLPNTAMRLNPLSSTTSSGVFYAGAHPPPPPAQPAFEIQSMPLSPPSQTPQRPAPSDHGCRRRQTRSPPPRVFPQPRHSLPGKGTRAQPSVSLQASRGARQMQRSQPASRPSAAAARWVPHARARRIARRPGSGWQRGGRCGPGAAAWRDGLAGPRSCPLDTRGLTRAPSSRQSPPPRAYPRHSSRGRKRHPGGRGVGASSGS